jgi:hypothetical protein
VKVLFFKNSDSLFTIYTKVFQESGGVVLFFQELRFPLHNVHKSFSRIQIIVKEKKQQRKNTNRFFFYSENLPLYQSTQKFFKNSSKKGGRFCLDCKEAPAERRASSTQN